MTSETELRSIAELCADAAALCEKCARSPRNDTTLLHPMSALISDLAQHVARIDEMLALDPLEPEPEPKTATG